MVLLLNYSFNVTFKWQYMAGAGAGEKIRDKYGAGTGAENK